MKKQNYLFIFIWVLFGLSASKPLDEAGVISQEEIINPTGMECSYYFIIDDRSDNMYYYSDIVACLNAPRLFNEYDENDFYIRGPYTSFQVAKTERDDWVISKQENDIRVVKMDESTSEYLNCVTCN